MGVEFKTETGAWRQTKQQLGAIAKTEFYKVFSSVLNRYLDPIDLTQFVNRG